MFKCKTYASMRTYIRIETAFYESIFIDARKFVDTDPVWFCKCNNPINEENIVAFQQSRALLRML